MRGIYAENLLRKWRKGGANFSNLTEQEEFELRVMNTVKAIRTILIIVGVILFLALIAG